MREIRLAESDAEIAACFVVMSQLRPKLEERSFVEIIRRQQAEGYRFAFAAEESRVVAVAGYRIHHKLSSGKTMYVDDLVTDAAARSQGHGKALLGWLIDEARADGCASFTLDSGTQRHEAHAFYFRERMRAVAFHFHLSL
ncbi:MAG TPA: GNAT family N-acetyltransferase [Granulicella sp.]